MKKIIAIGICCALPVIVAIIFGLAKSKPESNNAQIFSNSSAGLEKTEVARGKPAPEAVFTAIDGREIRLSEFKGKKVMFWFLATWCPSCITGAQVLAQNNDELRNLTIIALETYGNAGYRGPSIEEFAKQSAPDTLSAQNWLWGNASREATNVFNPTNFPDVYFLIDEDGIIRAIDGAPSATINKIIQFTNENTN